MSEKHKDHIEFSDMIKEIRDELTAKISDLSSLETIDIETTKLLKEITAIIKELDKMVKDNSLTQGESDSDKDAFYQFIKEQSLI